MRYVIKTLEIIDQSSQSRYLAAAASNHDIRSLIKALNPGGWMQLPPFSQIRSKSITQFRRTQRDGEWMLGTELG